MMAMRAARTGCVFTAGAAADGVGLHAEFGGGLAESAAATLRTMNDPRLNLWPAASNGSSAASNDAFGKR